MMMVVIGETQKSSVAIEWNREEEWDEEVDGEVGEEDDADDEDDEHQEKEKKKNTYTRRKRDRFLCCACWSLLFEGHGKKEKSNAHTSMTTVFLIIHLQFVY